MSKISYSLFDFVGLIGVKYLIDMSGNFHSLLYGGFWVIYIKTKFMTMTHSV